MRRPKIIAAVVAAGALCAAAGIMFTATSASAETAAFAQVSSWGSGYQGQVLVTNSTSSQSTGWKVEFNLPSGSTIASSWSAESAASGNRYTFTNMPWNGTLGAGQSTTFGFIVNGSGTPTDCTINGASCSGGTTVTTPPVQTTTPPVETTTPPVQTTTPPVQTTTPPVTTDGTPLGINGQLKVCGVNLCNQFGKPIQLKGMSSHGLQWRGHCLTDASLDALAKDWEADVFRIAMYVNEGGYVTDPNGYTAKVDELVGKAEARGMYSIIDFHTLTPGDPNANLENAKTFFGKVSVTHAARKGVIYEIANEPNGVSWSDIKRYANTVIPIIRANDPDAVIIVGTPGWSSLGKSESSGPGAIMNDKISDPNVMYAFHFYAASHKDDYRRVVQEAMDNSAGKGLPIFASEWGTVTYTGNGFVDEASSGAWLDMFDQMKISYANWTFSDHPENSAVFREGVCNGSNFAGTDVLTQSGKFVRSRIKVKDDFPTS